MSLVCPLLATSAQLGAGVAFAVRFPLPLGETYSSYIPGSRADVDAHIGLHVCAPAHTGSHAGPSDCGSPLCKILSGGGDELIYTYFPNTLMDSCCVGTAGIPFDWFMVTLACSVDRAMSAFPIIMSLNCRKIKPCSGLVK
jgi:hypothetical protein